jgi:hypothetical protein
VDSLAAFVLTTLSAVTGGLAPWLVFNVATNRTVLPKLFGPVMAVLGLIQIVVLYDRISNWSPLPRGAVFIGLVSLVISGILISVLGLRQAKVERKQPAVIKSRWREVSLFIFLFLVSDALIVLVVFAPAGIWTIPLGAAGIALQSVACLRLFRLQASCG